MTSLTATHAMTPAIFGASLVVLSSAMRWIPMVRSQGFMCRHLTSHTGERHAYTIKMLRRSQSRQMFRSTLSWCRSQPLQFLFMTSREFSLATTLLMAPVVKLTPQHRRRPSALASYCSFFLTLNRTLSHKSIILYRPPAH